MADKRQAPAQKTQPERADPASGDSVPTRRGFFGVLKKAAQDELVRRTSTKR